MTAPILKGSQPEQAAREADKRAQAVALERRRWWELEVSARRCISISEHLWEGRLTVAIIAQRQLAETLRDRTAPGVRATGKEYDMDRHIPVPLFTPRDRLQFIKEFATTLLISARQQGLLVTPEGERAAQKADATDSGEAGSGVDETLEDEVRQLAQAGESAPLEAGGLAVSEAPAS